MLKMFLKRVIFYISCIAPLIVLFLFLTQTSPQFLVQTQENQLESNENKTNKPSDSTKLGTQHEQVKDFIRAQAESKTIPVQSIQIIEAIPDYVLLETSISIPTSELESSSQSIQVVLDADPQELATQLYRLELVLKGIDFSKITEDIQEIDVRYKLPVLRTQKSLQSS